MIHKCNNNCEAICGFCKRYNLTTLICEQTKQLKKCNESCNCNMFKCFTLEKEFNLKDYLTVESIIKRYEGEDIT